MELKVKFKIEQDKCSNEYVLCINTLSFISIASPLVILLQYKIN